MHTDQVRKFAVEGDVEALRLALDDNSEATRNAAIPGLKHIGTQEALDVLARRQARSDAGSASAEASRRAEVVATIGRYRWRVPVEPACLHPGR